MKVLLKLLCCFITCKILCADKQIENRTSRNRSLPRTCSKTTNPHFGVQLIHPQPGFRDPFEVFCDQEYEGGGWIVIQNRYDGSVHFYRGWNDYERGFGDLEGEMWLGLGKIHELTYSRRYELHVIVEDWDGVRANARYSYFLVAGPEEGYMLRNLGNFSGSDNDNDLYGGNCAVLMYGAWWYKSCAHSNLNGRHMQGTDMTGMLWSRLDRATTVFNAPG